jgi:hypothetical protein
LKTYIQRNWKIYKKLGRFLDVFNLPKLYQEDINHLSRSIITNKIEAIIEFPHKEKSPGPNGFMAEFYQTFKEELVPILLRLFHEIEKEKSTTKPIL